jgi:S-adenosylmethionine:tRNA ribosyltransferase-isomerase
MRTEDFDYHLPPELIAQVPLERGESRLLVLHRDDGRIELRQFADICNYLNTGDTLVINITRVTARRLMAVRESGEPAEALLLRPEGERGWLALVKPGKRLRPGAALNFTLANGETCKATVSGTTEDGGRLLLFESEQARDALAVEGVAPLPPYIHTLLEDEERYQTVYSEQGGSAAAPTAGLHFTEEILGRLADKGVNIARVTLHVGVDTFRPVRTDNIEDHVMHGENFTLSEADAEIINNTTGRVVAIGTTSVRVLESAAVAPGIVKAMSGETKLFITPGYQYKIVQVLLTNFHLPKSTLLMLVSAFASRDSVMKAYQTAVQERFRFFSFGDAMLII